MRKLVRLNGTAVSNMHDEPSYFDSPSSPESSHLDRKKPTKRDSKQLNTDSHRLDGKRGLNNSEKRPIKKKVVEEDDEDNMLVPVIVSTITTTNATAISSSQGSSKNRGGLAPARDENLSQKTRKKSTTFADEVPSHASHISPAFAGSSSSSLPMPIVSSSAEILKESTPSSSARTVREPGIDPPWVRDLQDRLRIANLSTSSSTLSDSANIISMDGSFLPSQRRSNIGKSMDFGGIATLSRPQGLNSNNSPRAMSMSNTLSFSQSAGMPQDAAHSGYISSSGQSDSNSETSHSVHGQGANIPRINRHHSLERDEDSWSVEDPKSASSSVYSYDKQAQDPVLDMVRDPEEGVGLRSCAWWGIRTDKYLLEEMRKRLHVNSSKISASADELKPPENSDDKPVAVPTAPQAVATESHHSRDSLARTTIESNNRRRDRSRNSGNADNPRNRYQDRRYRSRSRSRDRHDPRDRGPYRQDRDNNSSKYRNQNDRQDPSNRRHYYGPNRGFERR